jgi:hypothetical protein
MRGLRRALAPGVLALLLLWGFAYETPQERRPFMVGEELRWVRGFDSWLFDVHDAADEARTDAGATASVLEDVDDCSGFERRVLPAPTERLAAVRERAAEACDLLAGFARAWRTDPAAADPDWQRGDALLDDADDVVYSLFGYTSPLPTKGGRWEGSARIEPRLSRVAAEWTGYPVEVRCFPDDEWQLAANEHQAWYGDEPDDTLIGFADSDENLIVVGPDVCEPLDLVRAGDRAPDAGSVAAEALADAVVWLGHEIVHIDDPDADEATAECVGMQRAAWTAVRLGIARADGQRLARTYWRETYPDQFEDYRSEECRDGGDLDEHPNTARWP